MAPEISQHGGDKGEFINRFTDKLKDWLKDLEEEKKKQTEKKEGDRVETYPEYVESDSESTEPVPESAEPVSATPEPVPESALSVSEPVKKRELFGFSNEIKSMENFLLDQKVYKEFKSLVILGEYGVGKTALCQEIFNRKEIKSVYAPRIWVSMSNEESTTGIDGKICVLKKLLSKGLGVDDSLLETIKTEAEEEYSSTRERNRGGETAKEKELSGLLYALHLNLRWKKYLIVFDDVREEDNWDEKLDLKVEEDERWGKYLSDGFPKGSGGRVIYTTRDEKLAEKLVEERHQIHRLWPLTDHHSVWEIYEAAVKKLKGREVPRNDKKCIDELMNKSRGLPLAAKLLAKFEPVFLDDEADLKDSANGAAAGESQSPNGTAQSPNGTAGPAQAPGSG